MITVTAQALLEGSFKARCARAMVSKCANPSCSAVFRRMGEGRLFRIEFQASLPEDASFEPGRQARRRTEYFWLCAQCAANMTIKVEHGEVAVSKLPSNSAGHVA